MNSAVAIKNTVSNANTAMAMRLAWVAKAASHPRRSVSATARSNTATMRSMWAVSRPQKSVSANSALRKAR